MKEYWVNVYEYPASGDYWYGNQYSLEEAKEQARLFKIINPGECKYRLHIKLKDKPGLTRHYSLKMVDGMMMLNTLPKYKPPFIGMKLSDGSWI